MRLDRWHHAIGVLAAVLLAVDAQLGYAQPLAPKEGLGCLIVNKNSGRCLSVSGKSADPGAKIVQGPMPEQAGPSERWTLLGADKAFRLRNNHSRLVLEIGSANRDPGVQAIQWHDQAKSTNQHWSFEPVEHGYRLRAGHSDLVLCIGQASMEEGGRAVQWNEVPNVNDQIWELRPAYQEYYWSFKGNAEKREDLVLTGPAAEDCVKFEADGLRLTLPLEHPDRHFIGVAKNLAIKGDFEVTVGFEILAEPTLADTGLGSGLFLGVDLDTQRNRATFTRGGRPGAKVTQLTTWFELTKPDADAPFQQDLKTTPTTIKAGRLRITRQGSELLYDVAEQASEAFALIRRHPFSDEDVKQIRIGGATGGPRAALDARVIDLRIAARTLEIAGVEPALNAPVAPAPVGDAARPAGSRLWLAALLIVGLAFVLIFAVALVAWLFLRQRRAARIAAGSVRAPPQRVVAQASQPPAAKDRGTKK